MNRKSGRNKTITLEKGEKERLLKSCKALDKAITLDDAMDSVFMCDSLRAVEYLPDSFVDLLIADPPYNLSKRYSSSDFKAMSSEEYLQFTENWISSVKRVLKPTASIYVCCDWKSGMIIGDVISRHFNIQNRITWQREKGRGSKTNWKNSMEDIWFATVSKRKYTFNPDAVKQRKRVIAPYTENGEPKDWFENSDGVRLRDTYSSNFWNDITVPYWSMSENTAHPTQKPEKLIAKLILASSNEGDIVLDPFSGSGTTAVVAKKLNRHYVCMEAESEYCALTQKRLEASEGDTSIQGYHDGVFWERNTSSIINADKSKGSCKSKNGL